MPYGLLILRVVLGAIMFIHGTQKLCGWFGGLGFRDAANAFGPRGVGFRAAKVMLSLVLVVNIAGAVAVVVGMLTALAAFGFLIVMFVALVTVWWTGGLGFRKGSEVNFLIVACSLLLLTTGAGKYSIDRLLHIADKFAGLGWMLGGLGAAAAISVATLVLAWDRPDKVGEPPVLPAVDEGADHGDVRPPVHATPGEKPTAASTS